MGSHPLARSIDAAAGFEGADAAALREMLEGPSGRREAWKTAPDLVVIAPVLDYNIGGVVSGYAAAKDTLSAGEIELLALDLTEGVQDLTDGAFTSFRSISVETAAAGDTVNVIRPGAIVVARYRGLRANHRQYRLRRPQHSQRHDQGCGGDARCGLRSPVESALPAPHARARSRARLPPCGVASVRDEPSVGNAITEFDRNAIRYASQPLARRIARFFTPLHTALF